MLNLITRKVNKMRSRLAFLHLDSLVRNITKQILKVFWIFPIKKENILFFSYGGKQYSCNTKYISEYISVNKSVMCNIIWAFLEPDRFQVLIDNNYKIIKYGSLRYLKEVLTSKLIITNNNLSSYLPIREEQVAINTWHGGGAYKKIVPDEDMRAKRILKKLSKSYKIFVSPCQKNSEFLIRGDFGFNGKILEIGYPRNDIFFKSFTNIKEKVCRAFALDSKPSIALYAPTFRKNINDGIYDLDTQKLIKVLETRFGGRWIVMVRGHHMITDTFDFNIKENVINATEYPDMQELLCAADILITDYSSSIWDFSLMNKPSILFTKDLEEYKKERDFYVPIEKWHFPIVKSNEELIKFIENFDEEESKRNIKKHLDEFGSFESGNATEIIVNEIKKIMKSSI